MGAELRAESLHRTHAPGIFVHVRTVAGHEIFPHHRHMDDAKKKPHPEGLHKILAKRDPSTALYLGDNIDDALAARDANVQFMAIIAPGEHGSRQRAARFRERGGLALLPRVTELLRLLK